GTASQYASEKLGVNGEVYVNGSITATQVLIFDNEGSTGAVFRRGGTTYGTINTDSRHLTFTAFNGASFDFNSGKVHINSLKTAQTHPTNYSPVYVNDDTGELYRIAS
ncbi:hypothetical protein BVY04_00110, partial [bacterium M21]